MAYQCWYTPVANCCDHLGSDHVVAGYFRVFEVLQINVFVVLGVIDYMHEAYHIRGQSRRGALYLLRAVVSIDIYISMFSVFSMFLNPTNCPKNRQE